MFDIHVCTIFIMHFLLKIAKLTRSLRSLVRLAIFHNSCIKIVRTRQPCSNLYLSLKYDACIKRPGSSVSLVLPHEHKRYFSANVPMLFPYFCVSVLIHNFTHCLLLWSALLVAKNAKNIMCMWVRLNTALL